MNQSTRSLAALLCLALAGCIPSLQPLYTPKDVVFDPALPGTWKADDDDAVWRILGAPNNTYDVVVTEEGDTRQLTARLVQVGADRYLDLYPKGLNIKNEYYSSHLMPIHHFARTRVKKDVIEVQMLNVDWLSKQFDAGRYKVRREKVSGDYVLTAPSAELQVFLTEISSEKDAFGETAVYRRVQSP